MVQTIVKTIGSTGVFATIAAWDSGGPANLTTARQYPASTFTVATFIQGETITFPSGSGKLIDTDSTGPGTGTYFTYDRISGNAVNGDTITGSTSGAKCIASSSTPTNIGVIWRGQCQNQEFVSATTLLTTATSTNNSTSYKELTTVPGASFRDNPTVQGNPLRYDATKGAAIRCTGAATVALTLSGGNANFRLNKLQITNTGANSRALDVLGASQLIDGCIIEGTFTGAGATQGIVFATESEIIQNCLIVQRTSAASLIIGLATSSPSFFNCTIVAASDLATKPTSIFLSGASGTVTAQNCGLFAGDSTKAIKAGSATYTFTTCYSDISGTAGVTQTTYANEFVSVLDATRDFRLKIGAAQFDTGTTDSTHAAIDIAGTTRPVSAAYDVGCWELVAIVPGGSFIAQRRFRLAEDEVEDLLWQQRRFAVVSPRLIIPTPPRIWHLDDLDEEIWRRNISAREVVVAPVAVVPYLRRAWWLDESEEWLRQFRPIVAGSGSVVPPTDGTVTKLSGYVVLNATPTESSSSVTKLTGYVILDASEISAAVTKLTGYAIISKIVLLRPYLSINT